ARDAHRGPGAEPPMPRDDEAEPRWPVREHRPGPPGRDVTDPTSGTMMNAPGVHEREEGVVSQEATPYLSHSRVSKYLHCPEQYRLYYVTHLRPKAPAASLVFGQVLHQALAQLFRAKADPVKVFQHGWNGLRAADLTYSDRES